MPPINHPDNINIKLSLLLSIFILGNIGSCTTLRMFSRCKQTIQLVVTLDEKCLKLKPRFACRLLAMLLDLYSCFSKNVFLTWSMFYVLLIIFMQ